MTTFRKIPPICPLSNLDMNFDNLVSLRVAILYVLVLTICNLHFLDSQNLKNLNWKVGSANVKPFLLLTYQLGVYCQNIHARILQMVLLYSNFCFYNYEAIDLIV